MKVPVTEKVSRSLFRKIYYKGHYAARRGAEIQMSEDRKVFDFRADTIRNLWQKQYIAQEESHERANTRTFRNGLLIGASTVAVFYVFVSIWL